MLARFAKLGIAVVLGLSFSGPLAAQAIGTYSKAAPYEDVKFELSDAIIRRGLVVDHTGQIGTMLERTGALATASRIESGPAPRFAFRRE